MIPTISINRFVCCVIAILAVCAGCSKETSNSGKIPLQISRGDSGSVIINGNKINTGGKVKVYATKLLDASAYTKGYVGYKGKPEKTNFDTSTGGEIRDVE